MKLIKVSDEFYKKIEKVVKSKGCTYGEAAQSLELTIYKNFPHNGDIAELFRCSECRPKVIESIKKAGYWPEPKEVIKIVEVPVGKVETGPMKHLSYEIHKKHLT